MKKREMVQRIAADTEITHIQADAAVEAILTAIKLVFRTLYRGFCLLRTEYGFCGLPASLSGLRDGCNGHGFAPIGSEPC
jgi:hypothetical protein